MEVFRLAVWKWSLLSFSFNSRYVEASGACLPGGKIAGQTIACVAAGVRVHPDAPGHAVHLLRPPVDGRHAEAQPVAPAARAAGGAHTPGRRAAGGGQRAAAAALGHPAAARAAPPRRAALRVPGAPHSSVHLLSFCTLH